MVVPEARLMGRRRLTAMLLLSRNRRLDQCEGGSMLVREKEILGTVAEASLERVSSYSCEPTKPRQCSSLALIIKAH